jgi:putative thioredoxin
VAQEALTITVETFMTDVVEASATTPVLVDFWAPWCGPCRQLMPVLDRLAGEYAGRFKLAKVNTDEQPELAQQLGIRSLPTVVLFKDRAVVDHFIGVVPEAQIRQMLDKHVPRPQMSPLERARALQASGDFAGARSILEGALKNDPDNVGLLTALAELRALEGDLDGARAELERLNGQNPNHPSVRRLAALLTFTEMAAANPDLRALREREQSNPADLDAKHALAVHQLLGGEAEPALQTWLQMMRDHRSYKDDLAKRSLVLAFDLLGESHPAVPETRKVMSRLLF